jgi:hypothetical protein
MMLLFSREDVVSVKLYTVVVLTSLPSPSDMDCAAILAHIEVTCDA